MQAVLRVGLAGCAHPRSRAYLAALAELEDAAPAGVWDAGGARAVQLAAECGARQFASLPALLAECDALIVADAPGRQRALAEAAAGAGLPTLVEPPLAATLADAQALVQACARAGAPLAVAFPLRYSQPLAQLRAAMQAGALGDTLMIRVTGQGSDPGDGPDLPAAGALLRESGHAADLLRWIWGREIAQVYAEAASRLHGRPEDDCNTLLIALAGSINASLDTSWSRPAGAWPGARTLALEITGTLGVAQADAFSQKIELYAGGRGAWRQWGDPLERLMLADWLAALRAGRPAPAGAEDGLRALEFALAALASAEQHLPVRMAL